MHQPSQSQFDAATPAVPGLSGSWSFPPFRHDGRCFGVSEAGASCDPLQLTGSEMAAFDAIKAAPSSIPEVIAATGFTHSDALKSMRHLNRLGYIEDVTEGAPQRCADWQGFCIAVATAALTVKATKGLRSVSEVKTSQIKDLFAGRKFSDITEALDTVRTRGVIGADETPPRRGRPRTRTETSVDPDAPKPAFTASGRRARGTAPVGSWTRNRYRCLLALLGGDKALYPLPELEVDAKRVLRDMEAIILQNDPEALKVASPKQIALINTIVQELGSVHGFAHPALDGRMDRHEAHQFIARWSPLRPASTKQVTYATAIADALATSVPMRNGMYAYADVSHFIATNRAAYTELQAA